jgi:chaperonin cofactor prefoldin
MLINRDYRSGNVLEQLARLAANSAETIQDLHQKLDDVTSRLRQLEGQLEKMQHRCGRCNTLHADSPDSKNVISPRL